MLESTLRKGNAAVVAVLLLGTLLSASSTFGQVAQQDSLALVALYESTEGPTWNNSTGWLTEPVADWYGVHVRGGRVEDILLGSNGLKGTLPAEIGDLSELKWLRLWVNEIGGPIPSEIGQLSKLRAIYASANLFSGALPPELGELQSLLHMDLNNNELSGEIPPELGSLASLTRLKLDNNQLSGGIPAELASLTSLEDLDLYQNEFSGEFPVSLTSLPVLKRLHLGSNQLTGPLPSEVAQFARLEGLSLWSNQMTGPIPAEIGSMARLVYLDLAENGFSGAIPPEIGGLDSLLSLRLERNQLEGAIPPELGDLAGLADLTLYMNQLSGPIPPELGQLTELRWLVIHENELSGGVPWEFGNLRQLEVLGIDHNSLAGILPLSLTNLTDLRSFYFHETQLCESLDQGFQNWLWNVNTYISTRCKVNTEVVAKQDSLALVSVFELAGGDNWYDRQGWRSGYVQEWSGVTVAGGRVRELSLPSNGLAGLLSPEIGTLDSLTYLNIEDNDLSGTLPESLMQLSNLDSLVFSSTGLCVSISAPFQEWIRSVPHVQGTGCSNVAREDEPVPGQMSLSQVYPNPVIGVGNIEFEIDQPQNLNLELFDATGSAVAVLLSGVRSAGTHSIQIPTGHLASGVYVVRLTSAREPLIRQLTVVH